MAPSVAPISFVSPIEASRLSATQSETGINQESPLKNESGRPERRTQAKPDVKRSVAEGRLTAPIEGSENSSKGLSKPRTNLRRSVSDSIPGSHGRRNLDPMASRDNDAPTQALMSQCQSATHPESVPKAFKRP